MTLIILLTRIHSNRFMSSTHMSCRCPYWSCPPWITIHVPSLITHDAELARGAGDMPCNGRMHGAWQPTIRLVNLLHAPVFQSIPTHMTHGSVYDVTLPSLPMAAWPSHRPSPNTHPVVLDPLQRPSPRVRVEHVHMLDEGRVPPPVHDHMTAPKRHTTRVVAAAHGDVALRGIGPDELAVCFTWLPQKCRMLG